RRRPSAAPRASWPSRGASTPRGRGNEGRAAAARLAPHDRLVQAFLLARPLAFLLGGALVVLALALGEAHLELDAPAGVVEVEGNEGVSGALDLADELVDLLGVHQQLAGARGLGLDVGGGLGQRRDVRAEQEERAAARDAGRLLAAHTSRADRLDLPPREHETGFEPFFDRVIVEGFFVLEDARCLHSLTGFYQPAPRSPGRRPAGAKRHPVPS